MINAWSKLTWSLLSSHWTINVPSNRNNMGRYLRVSTSLQGGYCNRSICKSDQTWEPVNWFWAKPWDDESHCEKAQGLCHLSSLRPVSVWVQKFVKFLSFTTIMQQNSNSDSPDDPPLTQIIPRDKRDTSTKPYKKIQMQWCIKIAFTYIPREHFGCEWLSATVTTKNSEVSREKKNRRMTKSTGKEHSEKSSTIQ